MNNIKNKTKDQLIREIEAQQKLIAELKQCEKESKKTEETLKESEEKYRRFVEDAAYGFFMMDLDGKYTHCNRIGEVITEYSIKELQDMKFSDLIIKEDIKRARHDFGKVATGFPNEGPRTYRIRTKTGRIRDIEVNTIAIWKQDKIVGFHGTAIDITERNRTEEQLKQYRSMVETAHDAIFFKDLKSRYIIANKETLNIFGLSRREVIGKNDYELMPDKDEARKNLEDDRFVIETGKMKEITKHMTVDGGKEYWFHAIKVPHYDKNGRINGLIGIARDISKRIQVEKELKESEKKFKNFIESASDIIYVVDEDLKFLYGNRKFLIRHGLKQEELIGKEYGNLHSGEGMSRFKERIRAVCKSKKPIVYEYQSELDGKYFLRTLSPVLNSVTEEVESIIVISRDITERKQSEEKLVWEKGLVTALIDNTPDCIYFKDKESRFIRINKNQADRFGIKNSKEAIGKKDFDFFTYEYANQAFEDEQKIIRTGKSIIAKEEKETWPDGNISWVSTTKLPLYDADKNIIGTCGISRDITEQKKALEKIKQISKLEKERLKELRVSYSQIQKNQEASLNLMEDLALEINERKRAEKSLKQKNLELNSLINNIPDMAWLKDADSNYIIVNEAFGSVVGKDPEYLVNKTCDVCFGRNQAKKFKQDDQKVIKSKKQIIIEESLTDSKKNKLLLESIISPIFSKSGNIAGTVGIARNITERKKIEQQLENSEKKLRDLTRHLQNIIEQERANIAREMHDELGQLITAMKMDIVWMKNQLPEEQKNLVEKLQSMADLTDTTINTVKRMSAELRPGVLDDLGLIAAMEWHINDFQKRTGIQCNWNFESGDIIVDEDRTTAVYRILQESLTNIVRHARASRVRIDLKKVENTIRLRITDNGIGITPEKISDPGSYGLIGINERTISFGGEMKITGKKGKGTTVLITIPLG
jgi:two-component system sensor histidine kinase UhpB